LKKDCTNKFYIQKLFENTIFHNSNITHGHTNMIEISQNRTVKVCHDGELHPITGHDTFTADIFDI